MTIVMIDYGLGNLRSVRKAFEIFHADIIQTNDPGQIRSASKVILPGVGAFQDGMAELQQRNLVPVLREIHQKEIPLLGICLGMQLFFEKSMEMGNTVGLGLIPGSVVKFTGTNLKIPHTGWNQLHIQRQSPITCGLEDKAYVYFNHSYYCFSTDLDMMIAQTKYGLLFPSIIQQGALYGVQFHPEKSQAVGLHIIKNFLEKC